MMGRPYRPISLLRYNVDIAPNEVLNYVRQPDTFRSYEGGHIDREYVMG